MQKSPLISVIVPVYNAAPYLARCVESILAQTHKNLEIILVDDGSTDNSLDICRDYTTKDNRVKVIHQENQGICAARNAGIKLAKGDFVAFVDQDDWLPKDAYQTLINLHQRTGAEIVWGNITYYQGERNTFTPTHLFLNQPREQLSLEQVLCAGHPYCWDKLYAKRLIKQGVRFNPNYKLGEDVDFQFQAAKQANFTAFTPTPVYCYFLHPASTSHRPSILRCISSVEVYQKIYRFCQEKPWPCVQQIYLSFVIANACLLMMTVLLYDLSNQYTSHFQEMRQLLCQHKRALLSSAHMGVAGRLFMLFPLAFPKMARWLFRRPWLLPRLQKEYGRRLVRDPQDRDKKTICP